MSRRSLLGTLASVAGRALTRIGGRLTERGRVRHALSRHPVLSATSSEGAHVRISGIVRVHQQSLEAPLSGRACVAYRARVAVIGDRGNGKFPPYQRGLPPSASSLRLVPFLVEDAGHVVLIDSEHALFDLPEVALAPEHRERQHRFMLLHGYTPNLGASFREVVIEPGMHVTVAGVLMRDVALDAQSQERAFREAPPATARFTGSRKHPIAVGLEPPR